MMSPYRPSLALALLVLVSLSHAILTPNTLPLCVRNPYLNYHINARKEPWQSWPIFWTGQDTGLSIMASTQDLNGSKTVYPLLGRGQDSLPPNSKESRYNITYPQYVGATYDASTTNFTYLIPHPSYPVELTISFLSSITPTSTQRQAIPACYVSIYAEGDTDVDVYMDMNGMWVTGDRNGVVEWQMSDLKVDSIRSTSLKSWQVRRSQEYLFTEHGDKGEWGKLYFTGPASTTFEAGTSAKLRQHFAQAGSLRNQIDKNFRGVQNEEPVFAFHQKLSRNGTSSILYTIAHVQDPVTQFASARGLTYMRPLWASYFPTDLSLLSWHYADFKHAFGLASNYSSQLAIDAFKSSSSEYEDIVGLSARQVLGATSFSGTPESPLLFLKEISSNGNTQTVDVIFPSFPFFLYTNPIWLSYLLEPLLEHQTSGQYPNKYSMHDLGAHFPNFTGHPEGRDEYMPVEECGNMLIMALAFVNSLRHGGGSQLEPIWSKLEHRVSHASDTNIFPIPLDILDPDTMPKASSKIADPKKLAQEWVAKRYPIWKQWTEYLIDFTLRPANQLSTDDFAGWLPLQTNLALKGIVGIRAMSELASISGSNSEAKYYRNISDTYIKNWEEYSRSRDGSHRKLSYEWWGSWITLYSLYPNSLLCFNTDSSSTTSTISASALPILPQQPLIDSESASETEFSRKSKDTEFIPHGIYANQSYWYLLSMQKYGLPLDSRHLYSKSDWAFQVAAVGSPRLRKTILDRYARWLNETSTDVPMTDLYYTEGDGGFGAGTRFTSRPVVGSHFAFLALEQACGGKTTDALSGPWLEEEMEVLLEAQDLSATMDTTMKGENIIWPWEMKNMKKSLSQLLKYN